MFIALVYYSLIIIALIFILHIIGIKTHIVILTSFTAFGILLGLQVALDPPYCSVGTFEIVATNWGDGIYDQSLNHFGDPNSAFAHSTIPWFLRTPQIYFFAPAIIFSLTGLVIQIIFNLIKKTPSTKGIPTRFIILLLIAGFGISSGIVYTKYDQDNEYPTQPIIILVSEGTTQAEYQLWETWETINSYTIENLSFDSQVAKIGQEFMVTGMVKNTGQEKGIVTIEMEVDGISASNEIALLPEDSRALSFFILFPQKGTYMVRMDSLSEYVTVDN